MSRRQTIRALLANASKLANYKAMRAAWAKQMAAAWRKAQREMDERCSEAVERLSEEEFERLVEEEEAKIEAFRAPLKAAAERDVWPKELYWGGV